MVTVNAGNIPAELCQLSSLKEMLLNNNNLSGKEYVQLQHDGDDTIAGIIPAELSLLSTLTALFLNSNNLSGKLLVAYRTASLVC